LLLQPQARGRPVSLNRGWRDRKNLGGLFNGQPSEKTQLHDSGLLLVQAGEFPQGVVEGNQVNLTGDRQSHVFVQSQLQAAVTFRGAMAASVVHEYLTHELGGDRKETGAAFKMHLLPPGKAHISFVHQSGALQSVRWAFLAQALVSQPAQICIDQRH
jgi:hypothetical protein